MWDDPPENVVGAADAQQAQAQQVRRCRACKLVGPAHRLRTAGPTARRERFSHSNHTRSPHGTAQQQQQISTATAAAAADSALRGLENEAAANTLSPWGEELEPAQDWGMPRPSSAVMPLPSEYPGGGLQHPVCAVQQLGWVGPIMWTFGRVPAVCKRGYAGCSLLKLSSPYSLCRSCRAGVCRPGRQPHGP